MFESKSGKKYYPTIGLEIHAELNTKTKMFCACPNAPFVSGVNTNICEVCTAQPGALPYVNKEAVKNMIKIGMAINGDIADFSEFDRKNYFYPDIPKAYQISQFKYPIVSGGMLSGVEVTRIHLEEDTATSTHKGDVSLVNFNRAGVPLMELVTEPVITDAKTAMGFAKELQLLLRTLGVAEANLEKGEMRIEANVSVSTEGDFKSMDGDFSKLGVKTEVKNLNSFKIVGAAIEYEIKRQAEVLESGGEVVQETRGFDENKWATFSQRKKENSADYRYFPDPDIPKYKLSEIPEFEREILEKEMPELPWVRRERYTKDFKIKPEDIEFYLQNKKFGNLFENASKGLSGVKEYNLLSNYISTDFAGLEKGSENGDFKNVNSDDLVALVSMITSGDLSSRGAKDLLLELYRNGGNAKDVAEKKGMIQKSDEGEIKRLVEEIIFENPKQVEAYQSGEIKMLQYFVGQGMKKTGGAVNPGVLMKILKKCL